MELTKAIGAVFIDLDGTLVDSAPDLHDALNASLQQLNYGPFKIEQTRQWIGTGLDTLLHRAVSNDFHGQIKSNLLEQCRRLFLAEYKKSNGQKSRLYPGVKDALDNFGKVACKRVCITNKSRAFTLPLLEQLGILKAFDLVLGGDDVKHKKPDPEALYKAMDKLQVTAEESLMIGDSDNDILAANRANVDVIGVSYGYSQGVDLSQMSILGMVDSMAEIRINNVSSEAHT